MKWIKQDISTPEVRSLAERYDLDLLSAAIFLRRGLKDPGDLKFFLEDDLRFTHNPFLFKDMERAVDRLVAARDEGEKVLVFGDRDADGITSTVILVESLRSFGLEVDWRVPEGDEPYGLTCHAVQSFSTSGGTLILTVDCGISNFKEVEEANSLGVDVIILDHHGAPDKLPDAFAIINPKVEGEPYPFQHLAACGVAAKLAWALLFTTVELYDQSFCLLHCTLVSSEVLHIDAVKMVNLLEVKRLHLEWGPQASTNDKYALAEFVMGQEILVYGAPQQTGYLKSFFGRSAEIALTDLAPQMAKAFPGLSGLAFAELRAKSRLGRYQDGIPTDLDILISLFTSYLYRAHPALGKGFSRILDLVAMGTLADMMPLEGENRILVKQGLDTLNSTDRPGLQALLLKHKLLGRKFSAADVSWQVTPIINAAGRLGFPQKAVELLLTTEPALREELAQTLVNLNQERRQLSLQSWDKVYPLATRCFEDRGGQLVLVYDESIPRGITGITATRIMNTFGVPALVLTRHNERIIGSLRSNRGFETRRFLDSFADLFTDYGGHNAAAGFSLPALDYSKFETRLWKILPSFPLGPDGAQDLVIDAELPIEFLNPEIEKVLNRFEPAGEGHRSLIFVIRGAKVEQLDLVGKEGSPHVKMLLGIGTLKWPAIYWNAVDKVESRQIREGAVIDLAFHIQRNWYQNRESLQLQVLDVQTPKGSV